ncbi:MAG: hypothetical protein J0H91_11385, partial [Rhodospirillales bacterium]|nr:hypothetical protein [Rhodospirillales bacterium]
MQRVRHRQTEGGPYDQDRPRTAHPGTCAADVARRRQPEGPQARLPGARARAAGDRGQPAGRPAAQPDDRAPRRAAPRRAGGGGRVGGQSRRIPLADDRPGRSQPRPRRDPQDPPPPRRRLTPVPRHRRFRDRRAAGQALATALLRFKGQNPVVLALPRGGVPVAWEVAQALAAPLDLVLVRKLGAPEQPELAVGAVAEGEPPEVFVDARLARHLEVPAAYLAAATAARGCRNPSGRCWTTR